MIIPAALSIDQASLILLSLARDLALRQTTQIYVKILDEAVSEDMQKMRSKFDKMETAVTPLKEKPTDFVREPPKKRGRPRKNPL